jgi:hypothetical protein
MPPPIPGCCPQADGNVFTPPTCSMRDYTNDEATQKAFCCTFIAQPCLKMGKLRKALAVVKPLFSGCG